MSYLSDIKLKPCPLCGAAFLIAQEPYDNPPVAGMYYIFHDYGPLGSDARECPIDVSRHFNTREEAIAAWNRRAAPTAAQAVVLVIVVGEDGSEQYAIFEDEIIRGCMGGQPSRAVRHRLSNGHW